MSTQAGNGAGATRPEATRTEATARREPGALENAVLATLWEATQPLVPADVQSGLARRGLVLAYTSVTTTLNRLHAKGLLRRDQRGRAFAYEPTAQAADTAARRMMSLLGSGPARTEVLSLFVAGLTPEDEAVLEGLLGRGSDTPPAAAPQTPLMAVPDPE